MTTDVSLMLLGFGFFWMIVACVLGLIQGVRHEGHLDRLALLADAGDLRGYHRELSEFKHRTTTHTHSVLFPMVAIVIALSLPSTGYVGTYAVTLAAGLVAAMVIWTAGSLANVRAVMGIGDLLLLGCIVMTALGLAGNV